MKSGKVLTADCCASDKVVITSDGSTFQAETKPGGVDHAKFVRLGSVTVPAGAPRSLFQVNSSNAVYAAAGSSTAEIPGTTATVSSAYSGYQIRVNGVVKGRHAWANDHDTMYRGNTGDMIAHMSEQMILKGGDVLTMEVEYGDHSTDQHLAPMREFEFKADSAYIDIVQIRKV